MIRAALFLLTLCCAAQVRAQSDDSAPPAGDPFGPDAGSPAILTPQWVGDPEVDAAIVLSIDDMRDPAAYEKFLRPVLDRLKEIDGRAPVSIMTCQVEPDDPQVRSWLREGLSIEVHTLSHPCPLLQRGDLAAAMQEVHGCIDLLHRIPDTAPVAFRMPCCDSMSSPSPRFYSGIFARPTADGHRLAIDSSVVNVFTADDKSLPREIATDYDGGDRFHKYFPQSAAPPDAAAPQGRRSLANFGTWIANYPYPYVINGSQWEVPCTAPSDWEGYNLHGASNPRTVEDWKAALDATVLKKGVFTLVFHPHGWIRADQVIELIEYADSKYGRRVKFLNFREVHDRLIANVDAAARRRISFPQPPPDGPLPDGLRLTDADGRDNGIRFADLDGDGRDDLVYSNPSGSGVYLFQQGGENANDGTWRKLWSRTRQSPDDESANLPLVVRPDGSANGAWFRHGAMWVQNEDTAALPDHIIRIPWPDLLHPPASGEAEGPR